MPGLRQLTPLVGRVYLPALLASLGESMLVVTLPLHLRDLGMSFTALSVVLAAAGVGALLFNVPAGMLIARRGDRDVMLAGIGVVGVSSWALAVVTGFGPLLVVRFVAGIGMVSWLLSRQTYMLHEVHIAVRGRAMYVSLGLEDNRPSEVLA
jgi:MFS family permease